MKAILSRFFHYYTVPREKSSTFFSTEKKFSEKSPGMRIPDNRCPGFRRIILVNAIEYAAAPRPKEKGGENGTAVFSVYFSGDLFRFLPVRCRFV